MPCNYWLLSAHATAAAPARDWTGRQAARAAKRLRSNRWPAPQATPAASEAGKPQRAHSSVLEGRARSAGAQPEQCVCEQAPPLSSLRATYSRRPLTGQSRSRRHHSPSHRAHAALLALLQTHPTPQKVKTAPRVHSRQLKRQERCARGPEHDCGGCEASDVLLLVCNGVLDAVHGALHPLLCVRLCVLQSYAVSVGGAVQGRL